MRSANAAQAVIGALVLLLVGAFGFRFLSGSRAPSGAASATAKAPLAGVSSAPLNVSAPSGSLALHWVQLKSQEQASPSATGSEKELLQSEERQVAEELKKRLGQNPALWTEVLEVLSTEDPRVARKIVAALPEAVGSGGEAPLIQLLQSGRHREIRKAAATLIGPRNSTESLLALVSAAQQDADSGVRYQALSELARRQGRAASPSDATTIDQTLRLRAQVDPDPELRAFALRATGQAAPPSPGHAPAGAGNIRTK
jgi:hypothetical protein